MTYMSANDFYEEDEPVQDILQAFERGEKRVTRRPDRGFNEHLTIVGTPTVGETRTSGSVLVNVC